MRHIFRKGSKRVVIGYMIFIITLFAVIETLLGNHFLTASNISLPKAYVLLPNNGFSPPTYRTTQQQRTPELRRNIVIVSPTKSHQNQTIRTPTHKVKPLGSNSFSFNGTIWDPKSFLQKAITKNCTPKVDPSNIKTPFKFYIYNIPSKFNYGIQRLFTDEKKYSFCYNLDFCGMGEELYQYNYQGTQLFHKGNNSDGILSVRNTHQFALEVIIHYKLLHSPYRTTDPEKADMFYIPAYTGLHCLTFGGNSGEFVDELFQHLETHESAYFRTGKPHFSTLSKIQREQSSPNCPTLRHPKTENITYIAIEKESNPYWFRNRGIYGNSIIVAPYPSYIHFINADKERSLFEYHSGFRNFNDSKFRLKVPTPSERNVKLFLAAGKRRSNYFRAQLLDQFPIKTELGPEDYLKNLSSNSDTERIMLITNECSFKHRSTTIPWMRKSVFCLQPPGDSPTRKSIYDSILSGCIPVLFTTQYKTTYPFQRHLDYGSFTYTIDEKLISKYNKTVIEIVNGISEEKKNSLYNNLIRVSKWFQYSVHNGDIQWEDDALTLILDELAFRYNVTNTI